jgi:hypothetical protein
MEPLTTNINPMIGNTMKAMVRLTQEDGGAVYSSATLYLTIFRGNDYASSVL